MHHSKFLVISLISGTQKLKVMNHSLSGLIHLLSTKSLSLIWRESLSEE